MQHDIKLFVFDFPKSTTQHSFVVLTLRDNIYFWQCFFHLRSAYFYSDIVIRWSET